MSTDNITAFLTKAIRDSTLAEKIRIVPIDCPRTTAEALARLSEEEGLPFTADEYLQEPEGELSQTDLDEVAGGASIADILNSIGAKTFLNHT